MLPNCRNPLFPLALALMISLVCAPAADSRAAQPTINLLTKADALPLAIDPACQIRKVKTYFLESPQVTGIKAGGTTTEESLTYERRRLLYGAITGSDVRDRYGNYFTFYWRSTRPQPANLSVRLEYRQQKLGGYVQAREVDYPAVRGSHATRFSVVGDDYLEQGRISSWRVLLIEDHQKIVALGQSYLWR